MDKLLGVRKPLFIGAHPDDIEFYCGGLVHMLARRGAEVTFCVATRGGKGRSGYAKARLEGLRSRHQADAAEVLGGARVVLFDYPDKRLPEHIAEFAEDVKRLVLEDPPDIVLSWDPDRIYNPHPDHQAAADAVKLASPGVPMCFYGTREPNVWIGFDEGVFRVKLAALAAHRTETPWYYFVFVKRYLTKKMTGEGAKVGASTPRC